MKILGNLLVSLIVCIVTNKNSPTAVLAISEENFYVVSPSSGSEKFYLELKRLRADEGTTQLREDLLCSLVINNTFFSRDGNVEMVDSNGEGYAYAQFHPEIDWQMFKKPSYTKLKSKQLANLTAIAEEPAWRLKYYAEDRFHFLDLKQDLEKISKRGHAICNFTIGRKIRICAVGLSAKEYRKKIEFSPQQNNLEPECEKKILTFEYRYHEHRFSEWVIGCKAKQLKKNDSATFYMSIGYEPYQFLIYHPSEGRTIGLIHHFYTHLGLRNPEYNRDK